MTEMLGSTYFSFEKLYRNIINKYDIQIDILLYVINDILCYIVSEDIYDIYEEEENCMVFRIQKI
jgi:hypothetical protein